MRHHLGRIEKIPKGRPLLGEQLLEDQREGVLGGAAPESGASQVMAYIPFTSPMVMPEVITGLSLLLLFVSLQQLTGWPGQRGFSTITIAHTTFAMAYVTVIVQSRLAAMDESLEEAAMDLGGRPFRVVFDITLPLIVSLTSIPSRLGRLHLTIRSLLAGEQKPEKVDVPEEHKFIGFDGYKNAISMADVVILATPLTVLSTF